MSAHDLEGKVRELRQLQALIEEAQTEAEAIKDAIKAYMGQEEVLKAGEYTVTYRSVTTSRLDTTALKKANPMLCEMFTKQTTIRRFCIA